MSDIPTLGPIKGWFLKVGGQVLLPKLTLRAPYFFFAVSLLPEISFIYSLNYKLLANGGRSKYVVYCWWECRIDVRKLAERSETKKIPENLVRFYDTMPRIFCFLLPKLLSFAPCSLFDPMLPAACTFLPHFSLKPLFTPSNRE